MDDCTKVGEDGVVHGRKCTAVFAVFGPYAHVPPKAQVQVSFQITSPREVTVMSDMVSDLGRRFHGSIEEHVGGAEPRTVSYRVFFFDPAEGLEARIGVHGEGPVDFDIKNLVVDVH